MATILVVDDNHLSRKLLVAQLSADGYLTMEAVDGQEGLRVARAAPPELIISDIVMPTMDGYGFVRSLRLDPLLSDIPVIFYTAYYHHREAQNLAKKCGVACVLAKPSTPEDLVRTVEQALAGIRESDTRTLPDDFDREHLRLVVDELTEQSSLLVAYNLRYESLSEFGAHIAEIGQSAALLRYACSAIRNLLGSHFAVIAVVDQTATEGVYATTCGVDFGSAAPPVLRFTNSQMDSMFNTKIPWRVQRVLGEALDSGLPAGYPAAGAFLAVPMAIAARVYGFICLADKIGADQFSPEDERLLSLLGTIVGGVYQNLTLRSDLDRAADRVQCPSP